MINKQAPKTKKAIIRLAKGQNPIMRIIYSPHEIFAFPLNSQNHHFKMAEGS